MEQREFNVVDYGAWGDGLHDDTVAFAHAAHAARGHGGGILVVPSGTYLLQHLELSVNMRGA